VLAFFLLVLQGMFLSFYSNLRRSISI
jgi:hypothetical protein